MTHQDIADFVRKSAGVKVSRSTVSAALSRAGVSRGTMRYRDELPWRVRGEHLTQYQARMLRLLGRRRAEMELTDEEDARLDSWMESLEDNKWVVGYAPDDGGFIYVDAEEVGDGSNGIPIRRRTIQSDEFPDSDERP
jgi:hypothetical protein